MNATCSKAERAQYILARCREKQERCRGGKHDHHHNKLLHDLFHGLQQLEHRLCDPPRWVPRAALEICEVIKSEGVVVTTRSVAVLGELSRIDSHLFNEVTLLDHVGDLFVRDVKPFIIGVGEVSVIWDEPFKLRIVGRRGYPSLEQVHDANPSVAAQTSQINALAKSPLRKRPRSADYAHSKRSCRRRSISSFSTSFRRFNSVSFKSSVELRQCLGDLTFECLMLPLKFRNVYFGRHTVPRFVHRISTPSALATELNRTAVQSATA